MKQYLKPGTVEEALELAYRNYDHFRYIAGGTDMLVNKFQGNNDAETLIDLTGIADLKEIACEGDYLLLGSLTKLDGLKDIPEIKDNFPALADAARAAATPVIRRTATIGGNILCENRCIYYNQSEWWRDAIGRCLKCEGEICIATGGHKNCYARSVSDLATVLISLGAVVEIFGQKGNYFDNLEVLYSGDGLSPVKLDKTSIIRSILLPLKEKQRCLFKKLRPRNSVDFTSLTTAVSVRRNGELRMVLGGVDAAPVVIEGNINDEQEDLIKKAMKKPRIVDNDVYSRQYRKEMIGVFLKRSLEELKAMELKN